MAYEYVGDCGCESSSWFLFKEVETDTLYELHSDHNSCYGFEGQFELEETTLEYLKSERFIFYGSFYDDESVKNEQLIRSYLRELYV